MKKYAIKDIKHNIILTGRYTYKEHADNSCNSYNEFYGSKRYEVIEIETNRKTNKSITPEEWHTKYFKCPYKCPYLDKNKQHVVCKTICMEAFVKGYTKGINTKNKKK